MMDKAACRKGRHWTNEERTRLMMYVQYARRRNAHMTDSAIAMEAHLSRLVDREPSAIVHQIRHIEHRMEFVDGEYLLKDRPAAGEVAKGEPEPPSVERDYGTVLKAIDDLAEDVAVLGSKYESSCSLCSARLHNIEIALSRMEAILKEFAE